MRHHPLPVPTLQRKRATNLVTMTVLQVLILAAATAIAYRGISHPITYGPGASKLAAATTLPDLTPAQVQLTAGMMTAALGTWSYSDAETVPDLVKGWIHPQLMPDLRDHYKAKATETAKAKESRVAIPKGQPVIASTKGRLTVVYVPYRQAIWVQGSNGETPTLADRRVAVLDLLAETPTVDNPTGLLLTRFKDRSRADWLKVGGTDYWSSVADKEEARVEGEADAHRSGAAVRRAQESRDSRSKDDAAPATKDASRR